jgi:hypothetical protein
MLVHKKQQVILHYTRSPDHMLLLPYFVLLLPYCICHGGQSQFVLDSKTSETSLSLLAHSNMFALTNSYERTALQHQHVRYSLEITTLR